MRFGFFAAGASLLTGAACEHRSLCWDKVNSSNTHLLDRVLHNVPNNLDLSVLAEPQDPPDSLAFDRWIPLRLEEVYPVRHRQVV